MTNTTDIILWIWFALTAVSVAFVAWDLITRTPEMKVMKWGWVLVTLYTGIVGAIVYWFSCREPAPGTHEKFVAPLWKQAVGSTIHCMAGDATGIIVAAAITSLLGFPMGVDAVIEYFAGFAFGLFIFQALFMKDMLGGSYWEAVKSSFLPEWLSMNAVMAGMIPLMIILMTRDMRAMEPTSARFWGIMSLASLAGVVLTFPVNYWLVAKKLKHGMGTERALGKGGAKVEAVANEKAVQKETVPAAAQDMSAMPEMRGEMSETQMSNMITGKSEMPATQTDKSAMPAMQIVAAHDMRAMGENKMEKMNMGGSVSVSSKIIATFITLAMLAAGVFIAGRYGDFSMRAGEMKNMQMQMNEMK